MFGALLVLASVFFACLVAEGLLRLIGFEETVFYTTDQHTGVALRPGAKGWWRREGRAYVEINSQGLRDREHVLSKPDQTYRIAVLGDSYAEALQVTREESFPSVLERALSGCPALAGRRSEVINFGVSNYGTAQELLALKFRVKAYSPDLVILAFVTGNDVRNNSVQLEPDRLRPFFISRVGRFEADMSFRQLPMYRLSSVLGPLAVHTRTLQLINATRINIKRWWHAYRYGLSQTEGQEPGLDDQVYLPPVNQSWRDAWRVTEELIVMTREESHAQKASFLLVTLSNGIQVYPDPARRARFMEQLGSTTLFYPEQRLTKFSQDTGIEMLALAPEMQRVADRSGIFFHGFANTALGTGHWNAAGHEFAGRRIAEMICTQYFPRRAESRIRH